jgi:hypothetical protein
MCDLRFDRFAIFRIFISTASSLVNMRYALLLLMLLPIDLCAQYASKYGTPQNMKFSSIEAHYGYYKPNLYAYDEVYLADFTEGKFQGNSTVGGSLYYRLIDDWYLKGSLDYWTESVQTEQIIISDQAVSENLTLNLVMAQLSAVYEVSLTRHFYMQGGVGAVISRLSSDHQRTIGDTEESFEAVSYPIMVIGFGSLNYTFDGYLDIGVEVQAIYGRSNHFVADFGKIAMSTAGPSAVVRVAYNFQNRWFRRKSHGAFRNHDSRR